jgi:hypothetical protein
MKPKVGELWRSNAPIHTPSHVIPQDTIVLIIKRQRGRAGGESHVVWGGGAGWISDHCVFLERVNEAR